VHRSGGGSGYQRRILIAVAAALIPMIAGCEAGTNAPSLHWHQPTDGTSKQAGAITISNAFVLGAPIGAVLPKGQNAGLFLGLTNIGSPDRLVSISAPGVAQSVRLPGNQITLASQHSVLLTGPRPTVILENLLRPLNGGSTITITLTFAVAGQITIQVPVMPRAQFYTTLLPAPSPTTPTTPTNSPTPSPTPSAS
jgi:copper(I)-binding protein